jgi:hypothetical protein
MLGLTPSGRRSEHPVNEHGSASVAAWCAAARGELVSAACCVTESESALGLKQRSPQLSAEQAHAACESTLATLAMAPR